MRELHLTPEQKSPKVTRIYIERAQPILGKTETGDIFVSSHIQLHRATEAPDSRLNVNNLQKLSNIAQLEVYIRDIGEPIAIDLPNSLLEKLADYLRDIQSLSQTFDCGEFVHFLHDTQNTFKNMQPITDNWELHEFKTTPPARSTSLKPGDVIGFFSQDRSSSTLSLDHFAIYLNQDVLLSQSGHGGKLIATAFSDTQSLYRAQVWTKLTPKNTAAHWDGSQRS